MSSPNPQVNTYLDRLLILALHEQRPVQDGGVAASIAARVRAHGERLRSRSPDLDPGEQGFGAGLYEPISALLWGSFDSATMFMADEIEVVPAVSHSTTAQGEEMLFGPIYGTSRAEASAAIVRLFDALDAKQNPFVAICRLKLADHLVALAGGASCAAVARIALAKASSRNLGCVVMRCWSWPEIVVVATGADSQGLIELVGELEALEIGDLNTMDDVFARALGDAIQHPVGQDIMRWWSLGRESEETNADVILGSFLECNVVSAPSSQFGFRGEGVLLEAAKLGQAFSRVIEHALGRSNDSTAWSDDTVNSLAPPPNSDQAPAFHLTLRVLPKPGHRRVVFEQLTRLAAAIPNAILQQTFAQSGTALSLMFPVARSKEGLIAGLAITFWPRTTPMTAPHILRTSTSIAWVGMPDGPTEKGSLNGYLLLARRAETEDIAFARARAAACGIARVPSLSANAWHRAVAQTSSRPELYGAVLELDHLAHAVWFDLMFNTERCSPQDIRRISRSVGEVVRFGNEALQQRVQFTPALAATPPLSAFLSFGVGQIVRMLDGLAAILAQAALTSGSEANDPESPARRVIVVFDQETSINVQPILRYNVLRVSLMQAMTPLTLTTLFHEVGHLLVRAEAWRADGYERFYERLGLWLRVRESVARDMVGRLVGHRKETTQEPLSKEMERLWEERLTRFLEDVVAHATWRRMCGGWEPFLPQFLAAQSMGVRTRPDFLDPSVAITAWTECITHLFLQRALHECDERLSEAIDWLKPANSLATHQRLAGMIEKALPFASGEIRCMANRLWNEDVVDKQIEQIITLRLTRAWIPCLGELFRPANVSSDTPEYFSHAQRLLDFVAGTQAAIEKHSGPPNPAIRQEAVRIGDDWTAQSVQVPWEVLSSRGCPTSRAVELTKEVLWGVTRAFETDFRGSIRRRSTDFAPLKMGPGLFTDFFGGIFVVGSVARRRYLAARLAAIQALAELSGRVTAGSVWLRLANRRRLERTISPPEARIAVTWVRSSKDSEAWLVDISPSGVRIQIKGDGAIEITVGDTINIEDKDGNRVACRIVWSRADHIGAFVETGPRDSSQWTMLKRPGQRL